MAKKFGKNNSFDNKNFTNKNINSSNRNGNPINKISPNKGINTQNGRAEQSHDPDDNEEFDDNKNSKKNTKIIKNNIKGSKKPVELPRVKKVKNNSGLFDALNKKHDTAFQSNPSNNFLNHDYQNEEEMIENRINDKLNNDLEVIEKSKGINKSLFSSSFLKIDENTYLNNQQSDQVENQQDDFFNLNNDSNNKQATNSNPSYKFNPNYPLSEFFSYTGSGTSPPCEEKHIYIVYAKPVYARLSQIIVKII